MKEKHYQLAGLIGFILAGFIFIAVGINYGDPLTILGSVVWVISCLIWMVPLVKSGKNNHP
jgi:hypothetical protein